MSDDDNYPWVEGMGVTAAARELRVEPSNIDKVVGLPEPKQRLEGGRIWNAQQIRDFAEARRQKYGT